MSKLVLSYLFKTNLADFRSAIIDDNTDKICRILDIERDYLNKHIDSKGNTALLLAIECASPLTVRLLLEQGAEPDQPNRITFETPLGLLASKVYGDYYSYKAQRTLEMAKALLDHGAYVDKPSLRMYTEENKESVGKETPLIIAVKKGNLPLAKLLIDRKANINYTGRESQTRAVHVAIANGDEKMYDLLEHAGALKSPIITSGDNTLLHWFCYNKENDQQINLLKKLLDIRCNINAQNYEKRTPLMLAAKNNMSETCRVLLNNGADFDKHDSNGNQAIDLSIPGSECAKIILQQIQSGPSTDSNEKVIWRKRIDSTATATQRYPSRVSVVIEDQISNRRKSSKYLDLDEEKSNISSHSYIYPNSRRESKECEKRHDRAWEKFVQTPPKRRLSKTLSKHLVHYIDTHDRSLS